MSSWGLDLHSRLWGHLRQSLSKAKQRKDERRNKFRSHNFRTTQVRIHDGHDHLLTNFYTKKQAAHHVSTAHLRFFPTSCLCRIKRPGRRKDDPSNRRKKKKNKHDGNNNKRIPEGSWKYVLYVLSDSAPRKPGRTRGMDRNPVALLNTFCIMWVITGVWGAKEDALGLIESLIQEGNK